MDGSMSKDGMDRFRHLLDDEAIEMLSQGSDAMTKCTVGELEEGRIVTMDLEVLDIAGTRKFNYKNGGEGSFRKLVLGDGSDSITMTLWNQQASVIEDKDLAIGDMVRCTCVQKRVSKYGPELALCTGGSIVKK